MRAYLYRFHLGPESVGENWAHIQSDAFSKGETHVYVKLESDDPWVSVRADAEEAHVFGEILKARKTSLAEKIDPDIALDEIRMRSKYRGVRIMLLLGCLLYGFLQFMQTAQALGARHSINTVRALGRGVSSASMPSSGLLMFVLVVNLGLVILFYGLGRAILDTADMAFLNHVRNSKRD